MDHNQEQAEWSVASELLCGRVHSLLGNTKQAQWTLEGALKESERVYGSNHIRKLMDISSLLSCSVTFSHCSYSSILC